VHMYNYNRSYSCYFMFSVNVSSCILMLIFLLSAVNSGALLLERLGSHGLWR
jgi:hypothetical protein